MFDYHVHTAFSDDCSIPVRDMLDRAVEIGLTEIALTDHYDPNYGDPAFPFLLDMANYHKMLSDVQQEYAGILAIKRGVEIGVQPSQIAACRQAVSRYSYDFVLASFHMSCGKLLHTDDYFNGREGLAIHRDFYLDMYEALSQFKDYSVVGHFNIVDRYLYHIRPGLPLNPPAAEEWIRPLLNMIIADGKGLELNTSSFRYNLPIYTPAREILQLYKELGGTIVTIGSDAHRPNYIADHFKDGCQLLESIGFKYLCTFQAGKPTFHKISSLF